MGIDIKIKSGLFTYKIKYFYKKPSYYDALRFIRYEVCNSKDEFMGFIRKKKFTMIIDLTKSQEELWDQYGKYTKRDIRRAKREGVRFEVEKNLDAFIEIHNSFVKSKEISRDEIAVRKDYLPHFKDNLVITKAVFQNEVLVMRTYIIDEKIKKVRGLLMATLYRNEDNRQKRYLMGRANRFLFYQEMLYFKELGYLIFDMGGYAYNTNDIIKKRICEFKDGFGGEVIEESEYTTLPLYIARNLKNITKSYKKRYL
jgi:lipid II:glycine glycyltransferase (peptidoglycan interpeptide bridge formation enzyme)